MKSLIHSQTSIEVWEWISNYILNFTGHMITYPYCAKCQLFCSGLRMLTVVYNMIYLKEIWPFNASHANNALHIGSRLCDTRLWWWISIITHLYNRRRSHKPYFIGFSNDKINILTVKCVCLKFISRSAVVFYKIASTILMNLASAVSTRRHSKSLIRDHFGYGFSQWETTL